MIPNLRPSNINLKFKMMVDLLVFVCLLAIALGQSTTTRRDPFKALIGG
jgi:hypothetical protein